jgi:hypothetical protein
MKEEKKLNERLEKLEKKIKSWEDKATTIIAALIVIGVIILAVYLILIFLVPWASSVAIAYGEWYVSLDSRSQGWLDGLNWGIFAMAVFLILARIFGDAM